MHCTEEQHLIERAAKAYARFCTSKGYIFQCPNGTSSYVENGMIRLYNVRGYLMSYMLTKTGRLRRVQEQLAD